MAPAMHSIRQMRNAVSWNGLTALLATFAGNQSEVLLHHDGYRTRRYSGDEVWRASHAGAAALQRAGVMPGDCVLIWAANSAEWVFAFWACLLADAIVVPIDPRSSAAFAARVAGQVRPAILLLDDAAESLPGSVIRLSSILWNAPSETLALPAGDPARTAEIVFTSGSTGDPKGVVISHANLLANIAAMDRELARYTFFVRLLAPVRVLNLLPFSHLFGQQLGLFLPALIGASAVQTATYSPAAIAALIRRQRIAAVAATPRMLEMLEAFVRQRFPQPRPGGHWALRWLRNWRAHLHFGWRFCLFVVGAAPLDPARERFWRSLSFVVTQGYGLTETAPIVSFDDPLSSKSGTVGRPLAGVTVRIADDGEILLRGASVFSGYFNDPSKTAAAFDADGWFHTGDVGSLDADGRLSIRGRKKDIIVTPAGEKVFPEDVEHVLSRIPGVREAAVAGPDAVHALLVLEPRADPDAVVHVANTRLAPHQKIARWSLWEHGPLPRTPATGKLRRAEIAHILAGGQPPGPPPGGFLERLRSLHPGRTLDDAGLSSLDRAELAMELEEASGSSAIELSGETTLASVLESEKHAAESLAFPRWTRRPWARALRFCMLHALVFPVVRLLAWRRVELSPEIRAARGPLLLAANHQSYLDVPLLLLSLPPSLRHRVAPAMWKEHFAAHFHPAGAPWPQRLSHSLQYLLAVLFFNAFPLPQSEAGAAQSIRYAGELADDGWSILIFPEGERTLTGAIGPFFPGVALLAARLRLPVTAIRIEGLHRILPRNAALPRPGRVTVRIDSPAPLPGNTFPAMAAALRERIARPL
jgi:long-chain acyl-CoA synthetase